MFEEYDDLLDVEAVQKMLHISRSRLYDLLHSGRIKGYQQGRVWRIPKQSVVQYIKDCSGIA